MVGDLDDRYIVAQNIKQIYCNHTGLNLSAKKEIFERNMIVTSYVGRLDLALAVHIMMFMLALCYKIDRFIGAQRSHQWGIENQGILRGLCGKTLGILGMDNNGVEMVKRVRAMDMNILAYDVKLEEPRNVYKYISVSSGDTIDEIFKECDFVALCVPPNDKTYHLISAKELRLMKKTVYNQYGKRCCYL